MAASATTTLQLRAALAGSADYPARETFGAEATGRPFGSNDAQGPTEEGMEGPAQTA